MSSWPELAITWVAWIMLVIILYQMESALPYHGDNMRMMWKLCEVLDDKLFKQVIVELHMQGQNTGSRDGS
jgi:hypothetical protein